MRWDTGPMETVTSKVRFFFPFRGKVRPRPKKVSGSLFSRARTSDASTSWRLLGAPLRSVPRITRTTASMSSSGSAKTVEWPDEDMSIR
ncbi:hypothetical protein [Streptomyces sp. CRN 30]|uniref:hypothetical protein n=1 Tax=Streptomyces sp. CRN 30 TaxID=3075613 RepID=UPI002A826643|nr:hypothetical protein [Streptomyces sp. CRN 30]